MPLEQLLHLELHELGEPEVENVRYFGADSAEVAFVGSGAKKFP